MLKLINYVVTGDRLLFNIINNIRNTWLDVTMSLFTFFGSLWFSIASCCFLLFYLEKYQYLGLKAVFALVTGSLIVKGIKNLTNRQRPHFKYPECHTLGHIFKDYSFPSGHTCAAFVLAVIFSGAFPEIREILLGIAFFTGLSRIYLGQHYPSDVLVGAITGCISGTLSLMLF